MSDPTPMPVRALRHRDCGHVGGFCRVEEATLTAHLQRMLKLLRRVGYRRWELVVMEFDDAGRAYLAGNCDTCRIDPMRGLAVRSVR